jgi:hypothetical protein
VAADIITEYLKIKVQDIHLRIPHKEAGAQGMAQNHHRSSLFAREFVIDFNGVCLDPHGFSFIIYKNTC